MNKLVSSGVLFEEFGLENCKIELIENYPCETIDELHRREGYYIHNTDCVIKLVAVRKKPEWIEANKEHLKPYKAFSFTFRTKKNTTKKAVRTITITKRITYKYRRNTTRKTKKLLLLEEKQVIFLIVEQHIHIHIRQDI